tara:strand:+ start:118 stop:480 length:363 start_codon:yes stop_codon:yes gene_type:complete
MRKLGVKIYTNSKVKNEYIGSNIISMTECINDHREASYAGYGHIEDFHILYHDFCWRLQKGDTKNVEAIDEVIKCFMEDCENRYDIDCGDCYNAEDPDLFGEEFLRIYKALKRVHGDLLD